MCNTILQVYMLKFNPLEDSFIVLDHFAECINSRTDNVTVTNCTGITDLKVVSQLLHQLSIVKLELLFDYLTDVGR